MSIQRRFAPFVGFLAAFYLLGCQDAPTVPQDGQVPGVQLDSDEADDEGEVSGEDVFISLVPDFPLTLVYDFEAEKDDGEVEGSFWVEYTVTETGAFGEEGQKIWAKGPATCFTIQPDGKTARLAGLATDSNLSFLVGLYAIWYVIDNGEGDDDEDGALDVAVDPWFGWASEDAEKHCAEGLDPWGGWNQETTGEIEVEADD